MLIDLVRATASRDATKAAVITSAGTTTYGQLLARSESIATALSAQGITRFGCAVNDVADVVACLVGASAVGAEPCVYPRDLDEAGWARLAARFGHQTIISDATVGEFLATEAADLPTPPSAPMLIMTTGTTGEPKGARHDWSRLLKVVRDPESRSSERWLLSYNINQFAGLQVLLHVLASGATLVVPESRRAAAVMDALRDHAVTHASGTPTFWRLVLGSLASAQGLALHHVTLGGEAVPGDLLARLRDLLPTASISHVYAGTEFGSAVSVSDGLPGLPLSVLERGEGAHVQLRIEDGELAMRSGVGMVGYHQSDDAADEWRRTGDLVEVRGDRIHFVGRVSEIINVGGAKVHPLPIEELITSVPGVEIAAVYGRPNAITGEIVAVDVVALPGADRDALELAIRQTCSSLPAAGRPRRIRFVEALEIRGNKIVRTEVQTP